MTKMNFILSLHDKLSGLPQNEVEERLNFYSEMIEDRIEDGLDEEEAVSQIGDIDEIAEHIISEIPFVKIAKEKIKPKKNFKVWEIVLICLGSPIWASLLIAALAVVLSIYASWWAIVISLWAVFASIIACGFAGIAMGILYFCLGNIPNSLMMLGAGFVCAGLSLFTFMGGKVLTKLTVLLTKKIIIVIKKSFIKKENVQ